MFSLDDIKAALRKRGPDSLGSRKVSLQFNVSGHKQVCSLIEDDETLEMEKLHIFGPGNQCGIIPLDNGLHDKLYNNFSVQNLAAELHFIGATLQLRGMNPIVQPLVDASGNVLVYNGALTVSVVCLVCTFSCFIVQ